MPIDLKLSRSNRVYCLGESVEGKIITTLTSSVSYQKIIISISGTVNLQVRGGVTGVIESLYSVVKPICIMKKSIDLATSAGKLGPGRTEINFSFSLCSEEKRGHDMFYETYHGGNISIQYLISADVTRGYLHKPLSATLELIVEHDKASLTHVPVQPELTSFLITQDTQKHQLLSELSSAPPGRLAFASGDEVSSQINAYVVLIVGVLARCSRMKIVSISMKLRSFESFIYFALTLEPPLSRISVVFQGQFRVTGNISTYCSLSEPINGELIVEASAVPIRSIDILLLRVESILTGERIISDTSVIQTIQIADGDVCRSITLPIYVILPRLLVCPTVLNGPFSIEFQVSIVISFQSELSKLYSKFDLQTPRQWLASLTLPLRVFRTS